MTIDIACRVKREKISFSIFGASIIYSLTVLIKPLNIKRSATDLPTLNIIIKCADFISYNFVISAFEKVCTDFNKI